MANTTIAVNQSAFNKTILKVAGFIDSIPPLTGSGSLGPFSASYQLGFKLTDGSVSFTNTHHIKIDHLEVTYDPMILTLGIDLPHIHFGGECIIPSPFGGCWLRLPEIDIFGGNPDISVPLDLSGIASAFTGEFTFHIVKQVLAAKGALGPHKAHDTPDTSNEIFNRITNDISSAIPILPSSWVTDLANDIVPIIKSNLADKWQFYLHDEWHHLRIIDIGDSARNILTHLLDHILDQILGGIPSIFRDIIEAILHPIINAIGAVLNIGDDLIEWLSSVFNTSFGLLDQIEQIILNFFTNMIPVYQIEDPYPALTDPPLIPVLIPIENFSVNIDPPELTLTADLG